MENEDILDVLLEYQETVPLIIKEDTIMRETPWEQWYASRMPRQAH